MNRTTLWTPEQLDELKKYAGVLPCSKIGKLVGRSKDAVNNKIASLNLPRFTVTFEHKKEAANTPKAVREPMVALYKNHEAAAKKALPRDETPSRIEWCPECFSPVSNWAEHFERLGHKRI